MSKFKLGDKVREKITKVEGVVVGKIEFLTGCDQLIIQPGLNADGDVIKPMQFDIGRFEMIEEESFDTNDVVEDGGKGKKGCDISVQMNQY